MSWFGVWVAEAKECGTFGVHCSIQARWQSDAFPRRRRPTRQLMEVRCLTGAGTLLRGCTG